MDEHAGSPPASIPLTRAQRRSGLFGRRILYVDDVCNMRRAVARQLRASGAVCVGADTHDQAVVLLAFEPLVDLAILDFQMPDGDVGHLVRRLRLQRPELTLVGTSASNRRADFAARGVDPFLLKPWTVDDLLGVAEWSEVSSGRDEERFKSTALALDLPESGGSRGLPARGRLAVPGRGS